MNDGWCQARAGASHRRKMATGGGLNASIASFSRSAMGQPNLTGPVAMITQRRFGSNSCELAGRGCKAKISARNVAAAAHGSEGVGHLGEDELGRDQRRLAVDEARRLVGESLAHEPFYRHARVDPIHPKAMPVILTTPAE